MERHNVILAFSYNKASLDKVKTWSAMAYDLSGSLDLEENVSIFFVTRICDCQ